MNKNISKVLNISSLISSGTALVFICLSIFSSNKKKSYLTTALGCLCLSNVLNIVRNAAGDDEEEE